jgi:hypothetical protein
MRTRFVVSSQRSIASGLLLSPALFLFAIAASCVSSEVPQGLSWQFSVDYQIITLKNSKTLCVAYSHDGGFAAVLDGSGGCNDTVLRAFLEARQASLKAQKAPNSDLFANSDPMSIPCLLQIPGVLKERDAGKGQVFFTADGVNDLIAIDLNADPLKPIFLHTGLQATDLFPRVSTLWISGSKGISNLNVGGTWSAAAFQSGLKKGPIKEGAFGEWTPASDPEKGEPPNLLVRDAITEDYLLPALSPASFAIEAEPKPDKKPAPANEAAKNKTRPAQKITLTNPYGKDNPLTFQLDSWCDPSRKGTKPACEPAAEGLKGWSVTSPNGGKSCRLTDPPPGQAPGGATKIGIIGKECVLEVQASTEKDLKLKVWISKPKAAEKQSAIEISFCALEESDSSCP